jgi:O-methyltransferase involved in polyketide biosynthesis
MSQLLKNKISDSAYLVNVSRAKSLHLSKDVFAHLWIPSDKKQEIYKLWDKYAKTVYPFDDIELGVRTNYFLQILQHQLEEKRDLVFINLGSGFTSYQYLVTQDIYTIEVDVADIINEKKSRANKLIKEKILPKRETQYLTCDFNDTEQRIKLYKKIIKELDNSKNTFVLMEGLLYYLPKETTKKLLHNNSVIQSENSQTAFDYWKPSITKSIYYQGMLNFYKDEMKMDASSIYLFNAINIINKEFYAIIEDTNVFKQEKQTNGNLILNKNRNICLEECYIKIQKKASTQHRFGNMAAEVLL